MNATQSLRQDVPEQGGRRPDGHGAAAPRPRPGADRDSAYWWEAVGEGRFLVQYCADCRTPRFPAREVCAVCLSLEWEWREGTGTGTVDGWTVTRRTFHPAFEAPYTVLRVALDDGPALYCWGCLVGADPDGLWRGRPVEAVFTYVGPDPADGGPTGGGAFTRVVDWRLRE